MKIKLETFIFWLLAVILIYSCTPEYLKFKKYEPFLERSELYKTRKDSLKFEQLKARFLETWINKDNCYLKKPDDFGSYKLVKVFVDNILHTTSFDTLVFLVTRQQAVLDSNGNVARRVDGRKMELTIAQLMTVIIEGDSIWHFDCNAQHMNWNDFTGEDSHLNEMRRSLKRDIIRGKYFTKDKMIDPTFFRRLFTEDAIGNPKLPWHMKLLHGGF